MLSDECKKCKSAQKYKCKKQFVNAGKRDKIYCPLDSSVLVIDKVY